MRLNLLLLSLFLLGFLTTALAQYPSIQYRNGKVMTWPVPADASLKVYRGLYSLTGGLEKADILGHRTHKEDTLFFEPVLPFTMGETYTAIYGDHQLHHFEVPVPKDYSRAAVQATYPSADTLPSNLLKFHLLFSRPMQMGNVYSNVALLTAQGDTIDRAILPLDPPLWNADRTALTLWLEPGRIKRDLGPNELLGPILNTGRSYTLQVDAAMKDENGQPLKASYQHDFFVAGRDTLRPDPSTWSLSTPKAGTAGPLVIHSGEPLDWATARAYLEVQTKAGAVVEGRWQVSDREQQIAFFPRNSWQQGRYRLHIDPRLEDVAGNNLNRLFDREVGRSASEQVTTEQEFVIP